MEQAPSLSKPRIEKSLGMKPKQETAEQFYKLNIKGDVEGTLKALREIKEQIKKGETPKTHPVIFMGPGGSRGAVSVGLAAAFQRAGLGDVFDTYVGASAGAPIARAMMNGEASFAFQVYRDIIASQSERRYPTAEVEKLNPQEKELALAKKAEVAKDDFINMRRGVKALVSHLFGYGSPEDPMVADMYKITKALEKRAKEREEKGLRNLPEDKTFIMTLTDYDKETGVRFKPTNTEQLITGIDASYRIPYPLNAKTHGKVAGLPGRYSDGGYATAMPVIDVVKEMIASGKKPGPVVVFANREENVKPPSFLGKIKDDLIINLVFKKKPGLKDLHKSGNPEFDRNIEWLKNNNIPYMVVYNHETKDPEVLENNPNLIDQSILNAYTDMLGIIKDIAPPNKQE